MQKDTKVISQNKWIKKTEREMVNRGSLVKKQPLQWRRVVVKNDS